jgi:hypothetical protein
VWELSISLGHCLPLLAGPSCGGPSLPPPSPPPLHDDTQVALDVTTRVFGEGSLLTGHRQLRMGSVRVGQGRVADAAGLLQSALLVR